MMKGLEHLTYEKKRGKLFNSSREGKLQRASQALHSDAQLHDKRQQAQNETWEALSEHGKTLRYFGGGQELTQGAQEGGGICILTDVQVWSRHGPQQLGLDVPA